MVGDELDQKESKDLVLSSMVRVDKVGASQLFGTDTKRIGRSSCWVASMGCVYRNDSLIVIIILPSEHVGPKHLAAHLGRIFLLWKECDRSLWLHEREFATLEVYTLYGIQRSLISLLSI